jgi:hypothetical protein
VRLGGRSGALEHGDMVGARYGWEWSYPGLAPRTL